MNNINYPGELTLEALATIDVYTKTCCNVNATRKKLNRSYIRVKKYLSQPYVRDIFKSRLLEKGITPEYIAEKIMQGLNAIDRDGKPEWHAIHKYTQLACEVFEVLKYNSKNEVIDNSRHINITNLQGEELIAEAKQRNIPIPEILARRYSDTRKIE